MTPRYPCCWQATDGTPCHRRARSGQFCQVHAAGARLACFWDTTSNRWWAAEDRRGLAALLQIALMILAAKYFISGMQHALMFVAGDASKDDAAKGSSANPIFAPMLIGFSFVLGGKVLSIVRSDNILSPLGRPFLWFLPLWCAAGALLSYFPHGTSGEVAGWLCLIIPFCVLAYHVECATGIAAPAVVLAGLALIFFGGLVTITCECVYQLTGYWNPAPAVPSELRGKESQILFVIGVAVCTAVVDAALGLCWLGAMVTPFPREGSPYQVGRKSDAIPLLILFCSLVMIGQAFMFRFLPWVLFKTHVLTVELALPFVLAIHYALKRIAQQNEVDDLTPN